MRHIVVFAAALSVAASCRPRDEVVVADASPAPIAAPTPSAAEKPLRQRPKNERELRTTPPSAYFANLDTQIETVARLAYADLKSASRWRLLAGLHRVRAMHRGDLDELGTAVDQLGRAIGLDATEAEAYVDRADALFSLRKLALARADLEQAAQLGADEDELRSLRAEIDWVQGRYDGARDTIEDAARRRPSLRALVRVAWVRHDLGDFDGAERAFEQAEDLATDENPVPIARLYAVRAKHLLAFGRTDEALSFVRDSLRRVPYEAEALATFDDALRAIGGDDDAVRAYEDAIKKTNDPRVWGDLSRIMRARGKDREADALKWQAMWRFGEALVRHPEAAYGSASRFFLEAAGDPARAVELARKDLAQGASSERWVAVANALLATGKPAEARDAIEKALAMPPQSARLYWTAARAYALTGDVAKSRAHAARARSINTRIEKLEPPLVGENAVLAK